MTASRLSLLFALLCSIALDIVLVNLVFVLGGEGIQIVKSLPGSVIGTMMTFALYYYLFPDRFRVTFGPKSKNN